MSTAISARPKRTFIQQTGCVFKAWIRQPSQVATICPSSPFLTEHLADRECVRNADRIIELGPGAGGTTEALLAQMRPHSRLLAIEKTEAFAGALNTIEDPRLQIEIADACDLINLAAQSGFVDADVLISGIPFSTLPHSVAEQIINSVHEVLRPGGVFVAYQLKSNVKRYAQPLFGKPKTELIPINLPPLKAFVWRKA